jgi:ribosome-associated protein
MTQKDNAPAANDAASTQINSTVNSTVNSPANSTADYPAAQTVAGWVVAALEDLKGIDIRVLDVRGLCNFADFMVFSSGTSDRHLKSQANSVVEQLKAHGRGR